MSKYSDTIELIRKIRKETNVAVQYYSAGGKDSIALLDMLAREFDHVICYYMYLIPNLDHIRPYITWAERHYPNVEVRQIEHFQRDYYEANGFFCDPDPRYKLPKKDPRHLRCRKIGDVEEWVRQQTGIRWAFSGMKGVDGYMKRMRLLTMRKRQGDYFSDKGMVYPLAVWTNGEVLKYIEMRNLVRPFVYGEGVSQGFTIDENIMLLMRTSYPNDYRRILRDFPYAEKLMFDYEQRMKNRQ